MNTYSISVTNIQKIFATIAVLAMVFSPFAGVQFAQAVGAIWTTTGSCGAPQNANHYEVGQDVLIHGSGFESDTYSWSIQGKPGGASSDPNITIANGSYEVTVGEAGEFCFVAYTVLEGDDGEYSVDFGGKNDNYKVEESVQSNGTLNVVKVIENNTEVDESVFSFTVTGINNAVVGGGNFESDGSNAVPLNLNDGPFTVVEVEANGDGYETTYSGSCTAVALTAEGATCTITNTYEAVVELCTDQDAYNYNQEAPCVYQGCMDDGALNYDDSATIAGECTYPTVTLCKTDNAEVPNNLSGWALSIGEYSNGLTGVNGCVVIEDVALGSYTIGETPQAGWVNVSGLVEVDVNDATETFTVVNRPENDQCLNLEGENQIIPDGMYRDVEGNCYLYGSISGAKYSSDTDAQLSGWTIFIDENDNQILDEGEVSDVTDEEGYSFENLENGTYSVCEVQQGGWEQTSPVTENGCFEITITEGDDSKGNLFWNREIPSETITACKYDSSENKIAGWGITITNDTEQGTYNLVTSGTEGEGYGCVSQAVNPEDGPWNVIEEERAGWDFVEAYAQNGTVEEGQGADVCEFFAPSENEVEGSYLCNFMNEREPEALSCSFSSDDYSVSSGQEFTLSWDTENADFVEIDNGIGDGLPLDGSEDTSVNSDTTFTLTASRYVGQDEVLESITCEVDIDRRSSGGGGSGTRVDRDSDPEPEGEVLGEATEILPIGAPDTGAGGTSPVAPKLPTLLATLVAGVRRTKNV